MTYWTPIDPQTEEMQGLYLSDEFKSKRDLNNITAIQEVDILLNEIEKIDAKFWVHAFTLREEKPIIASFSGGFEDFEPGTIPFSKGFIRYLGSNYGGSRKVRPPTFLLSAEFDQRVNASVATEQAETIVDSFVACLGLSNAKNSEIDSIVHSSRPLTASEFERVKSQELDLNRILRVHHEITPSPLPKIAGHEVHIEVDLVETIFGFLSGRKNKQRESKARKVKTSLSMMIDGLNARTLEQGFLTLYTGLNLLIEDIGQQSRSAKSESQMVLKLVDEELLTTQEGIRLIETLDKVHKTRSNILWGGESIEQGEFDLICEVIKEILPLYVEYWSS